MTWFGTRYVTERFASLRSVTKIGAQVPFEVVGDMFDIDVDGLPIRIGFRASGARRANLGTKELRGLDVDTVGAFLEFRNRWSATENSGTSPPFALTTPVRAEAPQASNNADKLPGSFGIDLLLPGTRLALSTSGGECVCTEELEFSFL